MSNKQVINICENCEYFRSWCPTLGTCHLKPPIFIKAENGWHHPEVRPDNFCMYFSSTFVL